MVGCARLECPNGIAETYRGRRLKHGVDTVPVCLHVWDSDIVLSCNRRGEGLDRADDFLVDEES